MRKRRKPVGVFPVSKVPGRKEWDAIGLAYLEREPSAIDWVNRQIWHMAIRIVASGYRNMALSRYHDVMDIATEAAIYAMGSVESWEPMKGCSLCTFSYRAVLMGVINGRRKIAAPMRLLTNETDFRAKMDNDDRLDIPQESPELEIDRADVLDAALATLTTKRRTAVVGLFGYKSEAKTMRVMAKEEGCSFQAIGERFQLGLKSLCKYMSSRGLTFDTI